jgi:hypothetical protein
VGVVGGHKWGGRESRLGLVGVVGGNVLLLRRPGLVQDGELW